MNGNTQTSDMTHENQQRGERNSICMRLLKSLSLSTSRNIHYCSNCGRHRSRRYHTNLDRQGDSGICSRPGCAQLRQLGHQEKVIVEIHHYYHTEGAITSSVITTDSVVELPGDLPGGFSGSFPTTLMTESRAPPVNYSRKPTQNKHFD